MFEQLAEEIAAGKRTGRNFGTYIQALAVGHRRGGLGVSLRWAEAHHPGRQHVIDALKAAVAGGTGIDPTWAGPLVLPTPLSSEFVSLIAPMTILGRVAFRKVPFNIKVGRITGGVTAGWVGEGKPTPVSAGAFDAITLGYAKAGSISVVTKDLAQFSSPDASALIAADAARAMAQFLDMQFVDPTVAGVAGNNPASITNGQQINASSGATSVAVLSDLDAMLDFFLANGIPLQESVLILSERTATTWAALQTASGNLLFPQLSGVSGGTILGVPVVVSAFPITVAVLAHVDSVAVADGGVGVDISEEAALQMDSAPSNAASVNTSLFQENLVGIRSIRFVNWGVRRSNAVVCLTGV